MSDETHSPNGPVERALAALGRAVYRRAGLVLSLLCLSLVPAGWLATQLEVRASFLALLPEEEPAVEQLNEVLTHARSASDIAIAIPTTDRAMAERFAEAFIEQVDHDPGVAGVGGHIDVDWFRQRRLLFLPEEEFTALNSRVEAAIDRELLAGSGLYIDLEDEPTTDSTASLLAEVDASQDRIPHDAWIVTTDGRYLCIWAFFSGNTGDLAFGRQAVDRVQGIVDGLRDGERFPRDLDVRLAGGIPTRVDDERAITEDLRLAGIVGFLAVVLLIVASLRSPRALVVLGVPLFIGLVWTFAAARLMVGHLNIISGFLFSILSGLGIEYGIHLMHRYRELRDEGLPLEKTIETLVSKTGRALLSGSLTNASVFGVIGFANFRGFADFGVIAAVGLLLTLVVTLTGLPALLVLLERVAPTKVNSNAETALKPIMVPTPVRWFIVVGVPVLAALSLFVLARGDVRFDGNWRLLTGNSPTTQFAEYLRHHFAGLYTGGLVYVEEDADVERVVAVLDSVHQAREARGVQNSVAEVDTLHEAFPLAVHQQRRAELAQELGAQLARIRPEMLDDAGREQLAEGQRLIAAAHPVALSELPYSAVGPFVTQDGVGSIVHLRMQETDDANTDVLVRWAAEAREIAHAFETAGLDVPMLSENWIAGEIFERVMRDGRFLLIGTLVAVFLVLLIDFRKPLVALGVLGSVLLGVLGIAGCMYLTNVHLNFMNAAILPVCVGISLDNAIHVFHRWREGGHGSIPMVLRHTTASNALASATNLLGFAALALTHHEGLRSVAYLAMIGVLATYISTTLWFPMVFQTIDALRVKKES